jgi:hypothetical protein
VLLPLALVGLLAVHLWRVRKDGGVIGSAARHRRPPAEGPT